MYADFESILEPIREQGPKGPTTSEQGFTSGVPGDSNEPYTSEVSQHIPSGWCVYSKFAYGEVKDPSKLYRGKYCVEKFCEYIRQESCKLYRMFPEKPMDPLTNRQCTQYKRASRCHICFEPFNSKNPKVRDHCRYIGCYRGPTHS